MILKHIPAALSLVYEQFTRLQLYVNILKGIQSCSHWELIQETYRLFCECMHRHLISSRALILTLAPLATMAITSIVQRQHSSLSSLNLSLCNCHDVEPTTSRGFLNMPKEDLKFSSLILNMIALIPKFLPFWLLLTQIYDHHPQCLYGLARLLRLCAPRISATALQYLYKYKTMRSTPCDCLCRSNSTVYDSLHIPYGPAWTSTKVEEWIALQHEHFNQHDSILHRHPCFCGDLTDIFGDCCLTCPGLNTQQSIIWEQQNGRTFVKGPLKLVVDHPEHKCVPFINVTTDEAWIATAYRQWVTAKER